MTDTKGVSVLSGLSYFMHVPYLNKNHVNRNIN